MWDTSVNITKSIVKPTIKPLLEKVVNAIEKKGGRTKQKFSPPTSQPTLVGRSMGAMRGKEEIGLSFWAFLVVFVFCYKPLSLVGILN